MTYGTVDVGMSLRAWLAGKNVAAQIEWEGMEGCDKAWIVGCALELADVTIAALEGGGAA